MRVVVAATCLAELLTAQLQPLAATRLAELMMERLQPSAATCSAEPFGRFAGGARSSNGVAEQQVAASVLPESAAIIANREKLF